MSLSEPGLGGPAAGRGARAHGAHSSGGVPRRGPILQKALPRRPALTTSGLSRPLSEMPDATGSNTTSPCPLFTPPGANLVVPAPSRALRGQGPSQVSTYLILNLGFGAKPAPSATASRATVPTQQPASHGPNRPLRLPTQPAQRWGREEAGDRAPACSAGALGPWAQDSVH